MCVAVVVDSPKRIPSDYLKRMADANPDGGGVAWIDGDSVQYRKGLTWEQIDALQMLLPRPFLMHFRIATRGGKIPELTHPFPIGPQAYSDDLVGMAPAVIIHNGTWSDFRRFVPEGIDPDKCSDTQTAAYVAGWDEDVLNYVKWSNAIMRAKGNGKASLTLRGQWQEFEGNQYSNMHWKHTVDYSDYKGWTNYRDFGKAVVNATTAKSHQIATARTKTKPMSVPQTRKKGSRKERRAAHRARMLSQAKGNPQNDNSYAWDGEPLFTEEAIAKAEREFRKSKEPHCQDCGQVITRIPCECTDFSAEEETTNNAVVKLTEEEIFELRDDDIIDDHQMWALLDALDDERGLNPDTPPLDLNDVEDMNAEGLTCMVGLDSLESLEALEDPSNEVVLSGDRQEHFATVDAFIRAQGIKI